MESRLNPDAPEFRPGVTTVQCPYNCVESSSNVMPHNWYGIFPDYYSIAYNGTEYIIDPSNNIMSWAGPAQHTIHNGGEYAITAVNQPDSMFVNSGISANVSTWNNQHYLSQIEPVSPALITPKRVQKPQINFKDLPDNTYSIWVPKIRHKANAKKPMKLITIYNENGEKVGFEHPYKYELETYVPPKHFIEPDRSPPVFPAELEATPLTYIHTKAQLYQLVAHLTCVEEFAIDVEHHSYRTYQGITCLIQISTNEGGDFIIDTLAIREYIHKLNIPFTDPKILKVLHGASNDVIWLQRDFGVYIVGLFDTYHAAKLLKISGLSLKNLLRKYCHINIDKKYQLADWRIRPLPEDMITYARLDTHYLLYIWRSMKKELLDSDEGHTLLCSVFNMCTEVCANTYIKPVFDANSYMSLYMASRKKFNSRQLAGLQMLYIWRDSNARLLDESPAYVLPDEELMTLAEKLPTEIEDVAKCCSSASSFVNENIGVIRNMILHCKKTPINPEEGPKPAGIRAVLNQVPTSSTPMECHNFVHNTCRVRETQKSLSTYTKPEVLAKSKRQAAKGMMRDAVDKSNTVYKSNSVDKSNTVEASKMGKTVELKNLTPSASKTGKCKSDQSRTNPSNYSKNKKINKFK